MANPRVGQPAMADVEVKSQVRRFYDSVGWSQVGPGVYQNARYEDLRPVSRDYIHRCHLRLTRHLPARGRLLLDAGSGPIQYPEYLEYSRGFDHRVCLDISRRALLEARARLGEHGLCVVGDVAHLPFLERSFEGLVSLHTIHHLPPEDQAPAFGEFVRVLAERGKAVVVYSWGARAPVAVLTRLPVRAANVVWGALRSMRGDPDRPKAAAGGRPSATGTYVFQHGHPWMRRTLRGLAPSEILVWRTPGTAVLRALIYEALGGRLFLRLLFWLEDRLPRFFGWFGQHPMIVLTKPGPVRPGGGD